MKNNRLSLITGMMCFGLSEQVSAQGIWSDLAGALQSYPVLSVLLICSALVATGGFVWAVYRAYQLKPRLYNVTVLTEAEQENLQELVEYFRGHVKPDQLHYIGLFEEKTRLFSLHTLDAQEVRKFLIHRTPAEQVEHYNKLGGELYKIIGDLNDRFRALDQGVLIRTIFDVYSGAVFYYHTEYKDIYLVGMTLNQRNIDVCDKMMSILTDRVRTFYNLPSISQIPQEENPD